MANLLLNIIPFNLIHNNNHNIVEKYKKSPNSKSPKIKLVVESKMSYIKLKENSKKKNNNHHHNILLLLLVVPLNNNNNNKHNKNHLFFRKSKEKSIKEFQQ